MPTVRGRRIRVLYDAATIAARNAEMAREVAAAGYVDLLVVSILKGSFVFAADLLRAFHWADISPEVEFLTLSSYRTGTISTGGSAITEPSRFSSTPQVASTPEISGSIRYSSVSAARRTATKSCDELTKIRP